MRRFSVVFLASLLVCSVSLAQKKPEAPKPKTDRKVYLAGMTLLAASKAADVITTYRLRKFRIADRTEIFGQQKRPCQSRQMADRA